MQVGFHPQVLDRKETLTFLDPTVAVGEIGPGEVKGQAHLEWVEALGISDLRRVVVGRHLTAASEKMSIEGWEPQDGMHFLLVKWKGPLHQHASSTMWPRYSTEVMLQNNFSALQTASGEDSPLPDSSFDNSDIILTMSAQQRCRITEATRQNVD